MGRFGDEFKLHLVNWSKICSLMLSGGLGVRKMVKLIELLWENGCGVMLRRGRLCGDRW
jgi:hypothetical protein